MSDTTSVRLLVSGRVQGVFYRAWTKQRADALGVSGWVRNCADGRVEAWLTGPAEAVEALVDACRQGPPAARVEDVAVEAAPPAEASGFTVRE